MYKIISNEQTRGDAHRKKLSEIMIMSLLSTTGSLIWSFINDFPSRSVRFMNDSFDESVDR